MTTPRPTPLRPLGASEIVDGAVRLVRRNARAVFTISVPYAIVIALATALLEYGTIQSQDAATIAAVGGLILSAGLGAVLTGLLSPLFGADLLGNRLTAAQALSRLGRRAWALFLLGLIVIVAEGAGLLACLVGGVWLWGIWAVAAPAFALEGAGVRASLRRSRYLVNGTFWRVWGIRALGWLLTYILGQLIVLPIQALALYIASANPLDTTAVAHPGWYVTIVALGQLISTALLAPISAAVELLIYTDLRMRKEGMDIVLRIPPAPEISATPVTTAW